MSVFCPKCGKRTYDEYKCDHCQYGIKPKKLIKANKEITSINKNTILVTAVVVIAISVAYLAINKLTEDTPQEQALKALYGTTDQKEIKKINDKMIKDSTEELKKMELKKAQMFKDMLPNK